MKKIILLQILFFFFFYSCSKTKPDQTNTTPQDRPAPIVNLPKWSTFQGEMNWIDAKAKCTSMGMRLPTLEELRAVYTSTNTKPWPEEDDIMEWQSNYWSSTPDDSNDYYTVNMGNGEEIGYPVSAAEYTKCTR